MTDDDLNNVTASPDDVAYECGYHDGIDYGYRYAIAEVRPRLCPACAAMLEEATP